MIFQRCPLATVAFNLRLRRGPFGAEFWNGWCANELGARETHFHGRLIVVGENSPRHGLYNGDVGVLWRDARGESTAWFLSDGRWRGWRPRHWPHGRPP